MVAGGLLFLCCARGAIFFGLIARQSKPANAAAESYVNAVIAGDDAKALQYVCSASGSKAHHDDFTNHVHSKGVSESHGFVPTSVVILEVPAAGTVLADVQITTRFDAGPRQSAVA